MIGNDRTIDDRQVLDAYRTIQRFKSEAADSLPDDVRCELREIARVRLVKVGVEPSDLNLESTVIGLAWIASLLTRHRIAREALFTVPEDIVRNTVAHADGFDPQAIQLGVGAGYFTGFGHALVLTRGA